MTATADPRPDSRASTSNPLSRLVPGLIAAAVGTAVSFAVNSIVPAMSGLTVAVILGVVAGNFLPARTDAGLRWGVKKFLRVGVVLLGLQLGLGDVFGLGLGVIVAVVITVLTGFFGTLALGRLLRVPAGLSLMVATGFSICGASAIAAMDSVTDNDQEDVTIGVTLVTLYGSAAIALIPMLGNAFGLTPGQLGAWAGLSVHEVAQVVAAASPAGAAAVAVAVLVKLTRVVTLAPMLAGVSIVQRRRFGVTTGRRPPVVPLFVVGFLAMVTLRSTGIVPPEAVAVVKIITTLLFAAALFGLGCGVRIGALLRTGRRGLLLGALSTLLVGLVSLGALALTGTI